MTSPLLLTRDLGLVDDVLRLAAAAGVTPEVVGELAAVPRLWASAPLVLVGADVAADLAGRGVATRREGVHVISRGEVPDALFREALALGAEHVARLPSSEAWLVELLTDLGVVERPPGPVVGVIGGSGGAGATTFAAALGTMAGRRGVALVIDLDPLGAGLDRVLGFEGLDGVRWDALHQTTGRLSARSLRDAVPRRKGLGLLGWAGGERAGVPAFAAREAISAARRGHDVVVIDLPRMIDPVVEEVVARCDQVLVMTVPTLTGTAAAARLCAALRPARAAHVVRGSGVAGITRLTGLPVLATVGHQRGVDEAVGLGAGPIRSGRGPLARAAAEVLDAIVGVS